MQAAKREDERKLEGEGRKEKHAETVEIYKQLAEKAGYRCDFCDK